MSALNAHYNSNIIVIILLRTTGLGLLGWVGTGTAEFSILHIGLFCRFALPPLHSSATFPFRFVSLLHLVFLATIIIIQFRERTGPRCCQQHPAPAGVFCASPAEAEPPARTNATPYIDPTVSTAPTAATIPSVFQARRPQAPNVLLSRLTQGLLSDGLEALPSALRPALRDTSTSNVHA